MVDERTGKVYDYSDQPGLEWKGIFAPDEVSDWAHDRQGLWNQVELKEDQSRHADTAQLARDFKLALPHELDADQRRQMVTGFAQELARRGMVVDAAIHAPDAGQDERNYHVHMLVTMRSIDRDGFGNKVREWNRKEEYQQWHEHWSQLGAEQLQRAGFHQEAERFRVGHLDREEQRKRALERGDIEHAKKLENERQKHMGPQATAMERDGTKTRKGDQNREVEERNRRRNSPELGRTAGEMRLAFQLTYSAQAFANALEDRGLILARVAGSDLPVLAQLEMRYTQEKKDELDKKLRYYDTRCDEVRKTGDVGKLEELQKRRQDAIEKYQDSLPWMLREGGAEKLSPDQLDKALIAYDNSKGRDRHTFPEYIDYVQDGFRRNPPRNSRFEEGELVVVNEIGHIHGIQRTTGADHVKLEKYLEGINTKPLPNVRESWEMFRALHEHRREEAAWIEREKHWPIRPEEQTPITTSPGYWFGDAARLARDNRPLNAPVDLKGDAANIWEAYHRSHTVKEFIDTLHDYGIIPAQVTKEESDHSHRLSAFAKETGGYNSFYKEGEIVLINDRARVFRLSEHTTGEQAADIERFLKKMDRTNLKSIADTTQLVHEHAEAREAVQQLMSILYPKLSPKRERSLIPPLKRAMSRAIGRSVDQAIYLAGTSARKGLRIGGSLLGLASIFDTGYTEEERKAFAKRFAAEQKLNATKQHVEKSRTKDYSRDRD